MTQYSVIKSIFYDISSDVSIDKEMDGVMQIILRGALIVAK